MKFEHFQKSRLLIHFPRLVRHNFVGHFQDIPVKITEPFAKLLKEMLDYDTNDRVTAKGALQNSWLSEDIGRSRNGTTSR